MAINDEEILKTLKEILNLIKVQNNILDSLHKLFNQLNTEYLIETHKDGLIDKLET
jgi:hypothetical protein